MKMKKNKKKEVIRCAVYTRVSTENQAEKDYSSLESQKEHILNFIKSRKFEGWELFGIYEDAGFSAASLDRPELQRMLRDIRKGLIDVVLVYKIDRLTRSHKDFYYLIEFFDKYNVELVAAQKFDTTNAMGRLLRSIMLDFAQFEREMTAERTRDKMKARAKKGLWNGGCLPLGYDYDPENKKLIINPKEAKIVKFIFETYLKEGSISKVVKALNKKGYKTKNGKDFIYTSTRHILENPIYAGKIKYSGEIYQGNHEAIIDERIFEEVQRMLKRNKKECKSIKQNKYDFLLRGLLRCGYCGSNLTTHYTLKNGDKFFYYKCTRIQHRDKTACLSKPLPAREFDNVMVESIGSMAKDNRLLKRILERSNRVVLNEIEELRKEEIKLEKEIERKSEEIRKLLNLFLFDKNPPIEVREEVNKRSKEKEELEKKLEEIRLKIRRKESTVIDFEIIKKGFEGFYKVYPSLEPKERQALARLFIKEVKIFNDKVDIEFLEFPELAHQDPVHILKEPSIRGLIGAL